MLTYHELGRRLKIARETLGLTQEQVSGSTGLSRVAISQLETGQRKVSSLELVHLARLYGRDITAFLTDRFTQEGALAVFFRANPDLAENERLGATLRKYSELCREYTRLEQLLDLDEDRPIPAAYPYRDPRNVWEAIQMGEHVAEEERRRLELGIDPIRDVATIVESQGVRVVEVDLDDEISAIFMADEEMGSSIFINRSLLRYARARRAFTIAHEYCHVLLDRDKISTVSKTTNARDLTEVRANAFAAAFLMPEEGVRQSLRTLGKGATSRETLMAYAGEAEPVVGLHRRLASSQVLTLYDVVQIQHHFGVSFETTLYRLKNLKLLSEEERERLEAGKAQAQEIAHVFGLIEEEEEMPRKGRGKPPAYPSFDLAFLGLVLEAYRQEQITYSKLLSLAQMVDRPEDKVEQMLAWMGIEEEPEDKVYYPE